MVWVKPRPVYLWYGTYGMGSTSSCVLMLWVTPRPKDINVVWVTPRSVYLWYMQHLVVCTDGMGNNSSCVPMVWVTPRPVYLWYG